MNILPAHAPVDDEENIIPSEGRLEVGSEKDQKLAVFRGPWIARIACWNETSKSTYAAFERLAAG